MVTPCGQAGSEPRYVRGLVVVLLAVLALEAPAQDGDTNPTAEPSATLAELLARKTRLAARLEKADIATTVEMRAQVAALSSAFETEGELHHAGSVWLIWATACHAGGRQDLVLQGYEHAERLARLDSDFLRLARIEHSRGYAYQVCLGQPVKAAERFRAAFDLFERAGDEADMAKSRLDEALALESAGQYDAGLAAAAHAVAIRTLLDDQRGVGEAQAHRARLFAAKGDHARAADACRFAEVAFAKGGDTRKALGAMVDRAKHLGNAGRREESVELSREAAGEAAALGLEDLGGLACLNASFVLRDFGRFDEAVRVLERGRSIVGNDLALRGRMASAAVNIYLRQGRFGDAEESCEEAYELLRKAEGDQRAPIAVLLSNRGLLHQLTGRTDSALRSFGRARRLFLQLGNLRQAARSLQSVADIKLHSAPREEARRMLDEAHAEIRAHGNTIDRTRSLMSRAVFCLRLGRFDEARALQQRARKMRSRDPSTDPVSLAAVDVSSAMAMLEWGAAREALDLIDPVLPVLRTSDIHLLANALLIKGSAKVMLGIGGGESSLREAVRLFDAMGAIDGTARARTSLAWAADARGDKKAQLDCLEKARRVHTETGDRASLARVLQNLAGVCAELSMFPAALRHLNECDAILRELEDEVALATLEQNRGLFYHGLGRHALAVELLASCERRQTALGRHGAAARAAIAAVSPLIESGLCDEAIAAAARAESILLERGDLHGLARAMSARGLAMSEAGRAEASLAVFDEALALLEKSGDQAYEAIVHRFRGDALMDLGRALAALDAYDRAVGFHAEHRIRDQLAMIQRGRARALAELGRDAEAEKAWTAAVENAAALIEGDIVRLGDDASLAFRSQHQSFCRDVARFALDSPRSPRDPAAIPPQRALLAHRTLQLLSGQVGGSEQRTPVRDRVADRDEDRLAALETRRSSLLAERDRAPEASRAEIDERLRKLADEEQMLTDRYRTIPALATELGPASPHAISAALGAGEALIELAVFDDGAWAFVCRPDGFRMVALGSAPSIRQASRTLLAWSESGSRSVPRATLRRLGKLLLDPVLEILSADGAGPPATLFVALHGDVARLPVEALLRRDATPEVGNADLPYLVRDFDVAYVPSGTRFLAMRRAAAAAMGRHGTRPAAAPDFYGVGFPLDLPAEANEEGREVEELAPSTIDMVLRQGRRRALLHGSWREIISVARHFAEKDEVASLEQIERTLADDPLAPRVAPAKGKRFRVVLRADANEARLKSDPDLRHARIVHFAGHAEADGDFADLSRLVLAQSESLARETGEDGFLYLRELASLRLSAELLVLSACETSHGREYAAQGAAGLTWAAMLAGAKSVLATLWRVDDRNASSLMLEFYRRLAAGETRTRALADAKRAAIASGQAPATWSAYVLWDAGRE